MAGWPLVVWPARGRRQPGGARRIIKVIMGKFHQLNLLRVKGCCCVKALVVLCSVVCVCLAGPDDSRARPTTSNNTESSGRARRRLAKSSQQIPETFGKGGTSSLKEVACARPGLTNSKGERI